jgi:hypothetical protein
MDHHAILELTPEVHHSRQMLCHDHCREHHIDLPKVVSGMLVFICKMLCTDAVVSLFLFVTLLLVHDLVMRLSCPLSIVYHVVSSHAVVKNKH